MRARSMGSAAARPSRFAPATRALVVTALLASPLGACTGKFTVPPAPDETSGVRPRCAEVGGPLRIATPVATVADGQLYVLRGTGGTGVYRWRIGTNASGGRVDSRTGVYVAGAPRPTPPGEEPIDTVDTVVLEDLGCRGEPDPVATITVVRSATVMPTALTVAPGRAITFIAAAGSGSYAFELSTNGSGGTVDDAGRYVAGAREGRDVVRLRDLEYGTTADAVVRVEIGAGLVLRPAEWVVPLGTTLDLPVEGGSGEYTPTVSGGAVTNAMGVLEASSAGASTITFTDRFTADTLDVRVQVVAPLDASRRVPGDRSENHTVAHGADLNGDGIEDVVVGLPDATGDVFQSGLIAVYLGNGTGLDESPAVVRSGPGRDEEYGYSVHVADLDGDGLADLLVGARRADPVRVNVGAVYLYSGTGDERIVTETPTRSFFGVNSSDLFGDSLVTCDFNGDGLLDLAVGAPFGQDTDGLSDQGAVHVFLAYPRGRFISNPDTILFGEVPVGGAWQPLQNMRLGEELAAGDFDGDGVCDLAAYGLAPGADQQDTGVVALYRGVAAAGAVRGGPELVPSLFWGRADGMDDNGYFGRSLGLADVDGDGRADSMATRSGFDGAAGSDTGAIYLRLGRDFTGPATGITGVDAGADWSVEGVNSSDRRGHDAMLFDVNGDGRADVVSGESRGSVMDSELSRPGTVSVFFGAGGGASTTADLVFEGLRSNDRFGLGVGAVSDLDGDGRAEIVAFAPYFDSAQDQDDDRGGLFVHHPRAPAPVELTLSWPAAGQRVGESVAWVDLDRDGNPELITGSSQSDITGLGQNVGMVRIHRGTANGAQPGTPQELANYALHTNFDEIGWVVSTAGDFDGDGNVDVAVLARSEDVPSGGFDSALYDAGPGCDARVDNPSAVLVFRGLGDGTVEPEPAFALFGPQANARIDAMAGGFDFDNDGLDDLIVGGRDWDPSGRSNAGGARVFLGRPVAADGRVTVVCVADEEMNGGTEGIRLGSAVAAAGDLDGDGCDDVMAGAPEADPGDVRNSGEVYVYFGYHATNCGTSTSRRGAVLRGIDRDSQAGTALAGGVDVTGDGVPDLLIGASRFRNSDGEVGRTYFVSGAYAAGAVGGARPMVNPSAPGQLLYDGVTPGERLGSSLSLLTRPGGGGAALLGGPFGASAGRVDTGGAILVAVGANGFGTSLLQVTGDLRGQSELGSAVHAVRAGASVRIAVGAPYSSAAMDGRGERAIEDGATYAFSFVP